MSLEQNSEWNQDQRYVLSELKRMNDAIQALSQTFSETRDLVVVANLNREDIRSLQEKQAILTADVAVLKMTAAFIGAATGLIVSAVVSLGIALIK
jgi:hypothetical protein